jgi:predicted helicase
MRSDSSLDKSLAELLSEFRATATSDADKGNKFERLVKFYFIHDPIWSEQLTNVRLREQAGIGPDVGIDLVAEDIASGGKVAIQCKFYDEKTYLDNLGTFYTASGKDGYVKRIVVTTSNQWTRNAEEALKNQQIPVQRILLHDMEQSLINWGSFDLTENYGSVPIAQKELRPHQIEALKATLVGFKDADRGKVIMACGTGKTLLSLRIAEEFFKKNKKPSTVLFLAPSISLLSQTIMEWGQNKKSQYMALAVCSDSKVGKKNDDDMQVTDLAIPASTDVEKLTAALGNRGTKNVVIFSTYQSLEIISKAQKQKKNSLPELDLVICDEAHRTTGVTHAAKAAVDDFSHFVRIHDNDYLKISKRLYMTATPKIYKDVDNKVEAAGGVIASMDDKEKFGEEFYRLGFGTAVESGLLSDYRVLILAVDEEYVAQVDLERFRSEDSTINLDDASKLLGCWRGLSKIKTQGEDVDEIPMKRAVAFANTIEASQILAKRLEIVGRTANRPSEGNTGLMLQTKHVDGKQNALVRRQSLEWLKAEPGPQTARILTNARCLSEGIDVPALDAVIFTEARGSQVDIVQAVGRVMRKHEGKNSGYIILPVAISAGADINETLKGTKYKVIWEVLNALRAHDDRFDVIVNQLNLNQDRDSKIEVEVITGNDEVDIAVAEEFEQGILVHLPSQIADGIYAKIVEKVGEREYWERWARDIASIAKNQGIRINQILEDKKSLAFKEFSQFLQGMQDSLNDSITREDAIEMLAQHLITKPIFEALFKDYAFTKNNPVSVTMDGILVILNDHIESDKKLEMFYESVKKRVAGIDNHTSRQKLITELYEKFFKIAFPKMTEKLGIVYTPVEIVDFILNSVEFVLQDKFNSSFNKKGVHILDPFTGTGTFITRLLQSGIIKPENIKQKYQNEIHANEIILLAYYIAAINIESTFAELTNESFIPFEGIVLADTFQMFESDDVLDMKVFVNNNQRAFEQKKKEIRVIIGNPPYSIGQEDANDNNQNIQYPDLDLSIKNSYVNLSSATSTRSMYDSYIRAFRWASNRVKSQGIVCFVTNGGIIETKAADGFRKSIVNDFSEIYVFNLRGDQRTKGEQSRREGGKIFGSGSRTPIAITLLIRDGSGKSADKINYFDIGDYHSRETKLSIISELKSIRAIDWTPIVPNTHGDWINQRTDLYESFIPLGDKKNKGKESESIFSDFTMGLRTNRDAWSYNYSKKEVEKNMQFFIDNYEKLQKDYKAKKINRDYLLNLPKSTISWSAGLLQRFDKFETIKFDHQEIDTVNYRPFTKVFGYRDDKVIERRYKTKSIFPIDKLNTGIATTSIGSEVFSALAISGATDLNYLVGDIYPMYSYQESNSQNEDFLIKIDNAAGKETITDWALKTFRSKYSDQTITKKDIFYYVYGVLSSNDFKVQFSQDARKAGPRVPFVSDFWIFAKEGKELFKLHSSYEDLPLSSDVKIEIKNSQINESDLYKVDKMSFIKYSDGSLRKDKTKLRFNEFIQFEDIPAAVDNFKTNGRSPLEWLVDQYNYHVDKDTNIVNDPNQFNSDHKYIFNLILKLIHLSVESQRIITSLPKLNLI